MKAIFIDQETIGVQNDSVSIEFSKVTGALISLKNLKTGKDYLDHPSYIDNLCVPFRLYYDIQAQGYEWEVVRDPNDITQPIVDIKPKSAVSCLNSQETITSEKVTHYKNVLGDCKMDFKLTGYNKINLNNGVQLVLELESVDYSSVKVLLGVSLPNVGDNSEWQLKVFSDENSATSVLIDFPHFKGIHLGDLEKNRGLHRPFCGHIEDFDDHKFCNPPDLVARAWNNIERGIYGDSRGASMGWDAVYNISSKNAIGLIILDEDSCAKQFKRSHSGFQVFYFPEKNIPVRTISPSSIALNLLKDPIVPPFRLMVYKGDWKSTAKGYKNWFESVFSLRRPPAWFNYIDHFGGDWIVHPDLVVLKNDVSLHDILPNKDNTCYKSSEKALIINDFKQLGQLCHSAYGPPGYAEGKKKSDMIEYAYYNDGHVPSDKFCLSNFDSIVEQYYPFDTNDSGYDGNPKQAGDQCWELFQKIKVLSGPFNCQLLADGTYYVRADLGGAAALRKGITIARALGRRTILYVGGHEVMKGSKLWNNDLVKRWAIQINPQDQLDPNIPEYYKTDIKTKNGTLYQIQYQMCPGCSEWQDHLAEVCRRLIHETNADGIRLDTVGHHWTPCYNKAHQHSDPFQWNQGMRLLLKKIRMAMDTVNPNAVLMTEGPVDFFHESSEGALNTYGYGMDPPPISVALPTYRQFDYSGTPLNAFLSGFTRFHYDSKMVIVDGKDPDIQSDLGSHQKNLEKYRKEVERNLRTVELHHTFASATVSGKMIRELKPKIKSMDGEWVCRLWKGEGYYLINAALTQIHRIKNTDGTVSDYPGGRKIRVELTGNAGKYIRALDYWHRLYYPKLKIDYDNGVPQYHFNFLSEANTFKLPQNLNLSGYAYIINAFDLKGKKINVSNSEVTLDSPCCSVFLPSASNPGLLTIPYYPDKLQAGSECSIDLQVAMHPGKNCSYECKISGNGLLVNNQSKVNLIPPVTLEIAAPKGIDKGFYFLTVNGKGFLPLKRHIEVI